MSAFGQPTPLTLSVLSVYALPYTWMTKRNTNKLQQVFNITKIYRGVCQFYICFPFLQHFWQCCHHLSYPYFSFVSQCRHLPDLLPPLSANVSICQTPFPLRIKLIDPKWGTKTINFFEENNKLLKFFFLCDKYLYYSGNRPLSFPAFPPPSPPSPWAPSLEAGEPPDLAWPAPAQGGQQTLGTLFWGLTVIFFWI